MSLKRRRSTSLRCRSITKRPRTLKRWQWRLGVAAALVHVLTEFQTANPLSMLSQHMAKSLSTIGSIWWLTVFLMTWAARSWRIDWSRRSAPSSSWNFLTLGCSAVDAVFHIRGHPGLRLTFSQGMRPLVTVRWTGMRLSGEGLTYFHPLARVWAKTVWPRSWRRLKKFRTLNCQPSEKPTWSQLRWRSMRWKHRPLSKQTVFRASSSWHWSFLQSGLIDHFLYWPKYKFKIIRNDLLSGVRWVSSQPWRSSNASFTSDVSRLQ